jgi:MFS family permease
MTSTRRALAGVGSLFFVNGVMLGSWLPRIPQIRDDLALELGALGIALSVGAFGSLCGSSVSGLLVRRHGVRRVAVGGAALLLAVYPLLALAGNVVALGSILAVIGFLDSNADVGMNAAGVRVEESVGRSIMTRLHGVWSLGMLFGSGLSALAILNRIGIGAQLTVTSSGAAVLVLISARLIPERAPRIRDGGHWGRLAIGLMVAGGAAAFVEGIPNDWGAIFLVDQTAATATVAGAAVILFSAGMLIGRFAGDHIVDRFGAMTTLASGMALSVAAMLIVVATSSTVTGIIGFGFWGLGIAAALPVLYKLAGSHPAFDEGSGLAALTFGTRVGFMIAPALIGLGAASVGLPLTILLVVAGAAGGGVAMIRITIVGGAGGQDSIPPPMPS